MKIRALTGIAVFALAAGVFAPVSAAQAATSTISGVVEYKGESVPGILVGWVEPSTGVFDYVYSKADGTYALDAPVLGHKYVVYANLAIADFVQKIKSVDYVGTFYGLGNERSYAYQALAPYISGESETVAVELAKPATLTGSDPAFARKWISLATVAGDDVVLASGDDSVRADSAGAFAFTNLVPGSFVLNNPAPTTIARVRSTPIALSEGTTTNIDPLVDRGATITGRVTDSAGRGLPKVAVNVGSLANPVGTRTNAQGNYTLNALPKSRYTVRFGGVVESTSKLPAERKVTVTGLSSGSTRIVNARVSIGAKLNGRITNSATAVVVVLDSHKRVVAAELGESKYSFSGLDSGKYTVVAKDILTKKYFRSTTVLKRGITTTLKTITTNKRGVTLKGHVSGLDSSDSNSLNFIATSGNMDSFDDIGLFLGGSARVTSSGNYAVTGIIPGTYGVSVVSNNRETRSYSSISLKKSRSKNFAAGTKLPLVRGVVTLGGERVSDGYFTADSASNSVSSEFSNGSFAGHFEPGTYTVSGVTTYSWDYGELSQTFQSGSPFFFSFPDSKKSFTVVKGTNLHLGTIELVVSDH